MHALCVRYTVNSIAHCRTRKSALLRRLVVLRLLLLLSSLSCQVSGLVIGDTAFYCCCTVLGSSLQLLLLVASPFALLRLLNLLVLLQLLVDPLVVDQVGEGGDGADERCEVHHHVVVVGGDGQTLDGLAIDADVGK